MLRVGPLEHPHTYSVTEEGTDADIRRKFADVFADVGKLKNCQLKLNVDKTVQPIAQPVRRFPFGLREKEIIEEVSYAPTMWLSPLVVVPIEAIVRERERERDILFRPLRKFSKI